MTVTLVVIGAGPRVRRPGRGVGVQAATTVWPLGPARIYNYLLDGKDNYPADRRTGDKIATHLPNIRQAFGWNRTFLRRAVRFLVAEAGIRQLIDIGTGLPAAGNVHDVPGAGRPGDASSPGPRTAHRM